VRVPHGSRKYGRSGYTPRTLLRHALNMLTGFSTRPLQLASLAGFAFACLGLAVLTFVLVNWLLRGSEVPGFTFLASTIAVFSGAQLMALGIIGEYLARMYSRTIERPAYVVRDELVNQRGIGPQP